jgi:L-threonylcarbamoyladenylate synthase
MISESDIVKVAGRPQHKKDDSGKSLAQSIPKAPGQHALHYSPRTPLLLFKERVTLLKDAEELMKAGKTCAALLIGEGAKPQCYVKQLSNQPAEVAEQLYGVLHNLDGLKVDHLLVELPPNTPPWTAVLDRLSRAGFSKLD